MLTLTDLMGEMTDGTPKDFMALIGEVKNADKEHTNVSATNEDGICLGVYKGNRLTLESLDDDSVPPHHLSRVKNEEISELVSLLEKDGAKAVLAAAKWQPGYGG